MKWMSTSVSHFSTTDLDIHFNVFYFAFYECCGEACEANESLRINLKLECRGWSAGGDSVGWNAEVGVLCFNVLCG